ncbi:hypothetical protein [Mycobacterium sp. GA-2829]|uniref:hypothetical protein n=1 Tax=Mycobacterium sp. GA-2829 TaxID=1772283 RepID=UPI00073FF9B1|nr:hypothetical protein [Mycobacterium sp. GA-2829]KUI38031.1 hypothetical protein AU194_16370 [Mycobacterium sp. GA-2829]
MIRAGLVLPVAATLTVAGTAAAQAQPPPPCTYTLSTPVVVDTAEGPAVSATVAPAQCGWPAEPGFAVACLQLSGDGSVTRCMQSRGTDSAQVLFTPYVPGVGYTATGRGCGRWAGQPPAPLCQPLGPQTAVPPT